MSLVRSNSTLLRNILQNFWEMRISRNMFLFHINFNRKTKFWNIYLKISFLKLIKLTEMWFQLKNKIVIETRLAKELNAKPME